MNPLLHQILDACRTIQATVRTLHSLPEHIKLLIRRMETMEEKMDKLIKESADSRKRATV